MKKKRNSLIDTAVYLLFRAESLEKKSSSCSSWTQPRQILSPTSPPKQLLSRLPVTSTLPGRQSVLRPLWHLRVDPLSPLLETFFALPFQAPRFPVHLTGCPFLVSSLVKSRSCSSQPLLFGRLTLDSFLLGVWVCVFLDQVMVHPYRYSLNKDRVINFIKKTKPGQSQPSIPRNSSSPHDFIFLAIMLFLKIEV